MGEVMPKEEHEEDEDGDIDVEREEEEVLINYIINKIYYINIVWMNNSCIAVDRGRSS